MRSSMRLALGFALAATFVVSLGTGSASANRSIQLRGVERGVVSSGVVTFNEPRLPAEEAIICDVTILKTLASSIPKIDGTLFGKVTGVAIDRGPAGEHCRHGTDVTSIQNIVPLSDAARPGRHTELGGGVLLYVVTGGRPELWKLIFEDYQGLLPRIEGIDYRIEAAQIRFDYTIFGAAQRCLYEGHWFKLIVIVSGVGNTLRLVLTLTDFTRREGGLFCWPTLTASGTLRLTPAINILLV